MERPFWIGVDATVTEHKYSQYYKLSNDFQLRMSLYKDRITDDLYARVCLFGRVGDTWQPLSKHCKTKVYSSAKGSYFITHRLRDEYRHLHSSTNFYLVDFKSLEEKG